jgi:UDP-N-acetylglucosamine:LPS N-acetylglucosamine transferase
MVEDQNLDTQLFATIQNLLNDTKKLESMRQAMRGLARPQAANHLAELLQELAAPSTQKLGVAS